MKTMLTTIIISILIGYFGIKQFGLGLKKHRLDVVPFKEAIAQDDIQLIDVRRLKEFEAGHIKGASLINVLEKESFVAQIKLLDKEKPTYIYCRSGKRSLLALKLMYKHGFKNANDLKGGYLAWQQENKN